MVRKSSVQVALLLLLTLLVYLNTFQNDYVWFDDTNYLLTNDLVTDFSADRVGELDENKPIVTVCRAGGRSVQAMVILKRAGLRKIANLTGGMLRWRSEGHHVIGGVS